MAELQTFNSEIKEISGSLFNLNKSVKEVLSSAKQLDSEFAKSTKTQDGAAKKINQVNKNLDILSKSELEIQKIQKQTSETIAKSRAERTKENETLIKAKVARSEQNKKIKESVELEKAEANSIKRLTTENKKLLKERNSLNTSTDVGKKRIAAINQQLDKNNAIIKSNSSNLEKQRLNVGNYGSAMQALPGPMGAAGSAIGRLSMAFKALLANPIVLILALIVGAITGLVKALKRSEDGSNKLNKIMAVLGAALDVILDIFTKLAGKMVDAFKDPKQAVIDLWEAIKTNLVNRVKALADLFIGLKDVTVNSFKLIGAAIKNIFSDNKENVDKYAKNIGNASKQIAKSTFQMFTGIEADKALDFFKKVVTEIDDETRATANLADRQAKLNKAQRVALVREGEIRRDIALLRETASKKEEISAQERLRALDEAISLENELLTMNQAIAAEKFNILSAQIALGESTEDNLVKEAQLERELIDIEAAGARKRKLLEAERVTAMREIAKENKSLTKLSSDDRLKAIEKDSEAQILEAKKQLLNFKGTEEQKALEYENFSAKILQIQIANNLLLLEDARLTAEEKLNIEKTLIDQQIALDNTRTQKAKENEDERREKLITNLNGITDIANGAFDLGSSLRDREMADIDKKEAAELAAAGDNEEKKKKIAEKYDKERKKIARKQAISDKIQALFNAGINTAIGITKAIPNIPLMAFAAIAGALQIASIAAAPLPAFEKGVTDFEGGTAIVGEKGSELMVSKTGGLYLSPDKATMMNLPEGMSVIPHPETQKIMEGGTTIEKWDELIGETIKTREAMLNRPVKETNLTREGLSTAFRKNGSRTQWLDTYIRS